MSSLESHSLGHSDKDKGRDCLQHYESFYAISIRCVEQYCSLHQFCVCTAPASSSLFADETTYILESEFGRTTNGVHKYAQTTHTHKNCSLCFNNNIPHAQTRKKYSLDQYTSVQSTYSFSPPKITVYCKPTNQTT
jgi:hypothetical protein